MKTFVIGLLLLGVTSLSYSQNNGDTKIKEEKLKAVTVTPLNTTYLRSVQDKNTPAPVKNLENKAARYDITESPIFNKKFEAYEVLFEQENGRIVATYDQNGNIVNSLERFEKLFLPEEVRTTIHKTYPGWTIHKDMYIVSYFKGKDVNKVYKVQLRNGSAKKNLKINTQGKVMK